MRPEMLLLAATLCAALTWLLSRSAVVLGMVDQPGGHKHHETPVAMVGGLAIAGTLLIMLLPFTTLMAPAQLAALIAAAAMLVTGTIDDRISLAPRTRLLVQALVALLLAQFADARLIDLGALFDGSQIVQLGWFAWPMTVFSVVGVINACNMSDGIDGAAGGLVALALAGAMILAGSQAVPADLAIVSVTLAAVLGFLVWNLPLLRSARAYLGDGGSLLLGSLLAWVLVGFSQGPERIFAPVTALWLYALPLIDTVSVMWRRMAERRSPFQPDQRHLHHVLLRAGLSVRLSWMVMMLLGLGGVVVAVCATRFNWSEPMLALLFLLLAFSHHFVMWRADRSGSWLSLPLAADVGAAAARRRAAGRA